MSTSDNQTSDGSVKSVDIGVPHSPFISSLILSQVRDHFSIVGTDYLYKMVNDAYLNAHCLQRSNVVGSHARDILGCKIFEDLVKPNLDRCFEGEEIHHYAEFNFRRCHEPKYMHVSYYPHFDEDQNLVGAIVSAHDVTKLKKSEAYYAELANTDSLTGLPNHSYAINQLELLIANYKRHREIFTVLLVDINNFKQVNATAGRLVGDQVLVAVAERLAKALRHEESLIRMGGDKFIAFVSHFPSRLEDCNLVQRLKSAMQNPICISGYEFPLGISISIAFCPDDGETPEGLLEIVDRRRCQEK